MRRRELPASGNARGTTTEVIDADWSDGHSVSLEKYHRLESQNNWNRMLKRLFFITSVAALGLIYSSFYFDWVDLRSRLAEISAIKGPCGLDDDDRGGLDRVILRAMLTGESPFDKGVGDE